MPFTKQSGYDVRLEWGPRGLRALADCRLFIVVDVLSFTTSVAVAVSRGATVYPFPWGREAADTFARERNAILAQRRQDPVAFSLSPRSLLALTPGARIVLPSPNGSTISFAAAEYGTVLAGSLTNRSAVAQHALSNVVGPIAVIAAGERWPDDDSLRPCLEDWLGAGSIIDKLPGSRSPEAAAAAETFRSSAGSLESSLADCASGRQLVDLGFQRDVELAARLDSIPVAPTLIEGEFVSGPSSADGQT